MLAEVVKQLGSCWGKQRQHATIAKRQTCSNTSMKASSVRKQHHQASCCCSLKRSVQRLASQAQALTICPSLRLAVVRFCISSGSRFSCGCSFCYCCLLLLCACFFFVVGCCLVLVFLWFVVCSALSWFLNIAWLFLLLLLLLSMLCRCYSSCFAVSIWQRKSLVGCKGWLGESTNLFCLLFARRCEALSVLFAATCIVVAILIGFCCYSHGFGILRCLLLAIYALQRLARRTGKANPHVPEVGAPDTATVLAFPRWTSGGIVKLHFWPKVLSIAATFEPESRQKPSLSFIRECFLLLY